MNYDYAQDLGDKLQNIYEGDDRVKGDKLQTFKYKFEALKMKGRQRHCCLLSVS
jgi:hypothetical protein